MSLSDLDLDQILDEIEQEEFDQRVDAMVRDVLPTLDLDNDQAIVQPQVLHQEINQEQPQLSLIDDDDLWAQVRDMLKDIKDEETVIWRNREGHSKKIIRNMKKINSKRFLTVITLLALVIGLYTSCRQFIVGIIEQMVKIDDYESVITTFTTTASGASTSMSWMALYTISRSIVQRYLSLSDGTVSGSSWKAKCCEFAEYFILFVFVILFYIPYFYAILELTVYDQSAFYAAFIIWVLIIIFHLLHACGLFSSNSSLIRNITSDDAELFVTVNAGFYASFCSLYIIFDAIYREFKYLDFPKKSSISYSEHFVFINLQIQSGSSILMAVLCAVWLLSKSVSGDRLSLKNKKRKGIALVALLLNIIYFVLILIGRLS